jgi:hypothetical protein
VRQHTDDEGRAVCPAFEEEGMLVVCDAHPANPALNAETSPLPARHDGPTKIHGPFNSPVCRYPAYLGFF